MKPDEPPEPAQGAGQASLAPASGPLTITRSPCLQAECELTFTFSQPIVRAPRKGRSSAVTIAFEPAQPGRFEWKSATELVFHPGPGALPWGHEIHVTIASATPLEGSALQEPWTETFSVPYFQAAGKVARWPVIEGQPRFVGFLNGRTEQIGAGPLYLLYDQPVTPGRVAGAIRLSHGRKALAIDVTRPSSIAHVWSGEIDTRLLVAVRARRLPEDGQELSLQYPTMLDGSVPAVDTRPLTVQKTFAFTGMSMEGRASDTDRMPLSGTMMLTFNNPVSAQAIKKAVSVTPAPRHLGVSWVWATEANLHVELDPGVAYRMTLSPDLEDELGNRLGKAQTLAFTSHDLPPGLALPTEPMILERGHARVPVRATNTRSIEARFLAAGSPADFIRMLRGGAGPCSAKVAAPSWRWTLASEPRRNLEVMHEASLQVTDKKGALGCLEVMANGAGSQAQAQPLREAVPVQTTSLGITAKIHAHGILVWATRLHDAAPASGATVKLLDEQGKVLATATTGAEGVAELDAAGITRRAGLVRTGYVLVETQDDMAMAELREDRLAQPWQFNMRGNVKDIAELSASVFTDRGVYRPDETVHIKMIVREPLTGREPARGRVAVAVSDPRGKDVTSRTVELDEYGSAHLDVKLGKNAQVGRYGIRLSQDEHVAAQSFLVEEYRVPTFDVAVSAAEPWTSGQTGHATIAARYYHGGELAARPVRFAVSRERVPFAPAAFPGFVFETVGPNWPDAKAQGGIIAAGEARLDGQGRFAVEFGTTHPSTSGPMRYVVDATVTDVDRQAYKGRLDQIIHPASLYVGVRPVLDDILAEGDVLEVPVVAVTPQGQARAGVVAKLRLERIDYHTTARLAGQASVELDNRPMVKVVDQCDVRTHRRAVICKLRVPRAGQYRVVASARDDRRALVESGFGFMASGSHAIAWPRYAHERVDLIPEKTTYRPGEVAELMVQSPFRKARGLLTIERGQVIEHRLFDIDGDAPVIRVPVTDAHVPNMFVSAILVQPRVHEQRDATGFETGAPSFRMGYAELRVEPTSLGLGVQVSSQKTAHPRARLDIGIDVRDAQNAPAQGLATVMVVDEAVLRMTRYRTPEPLADLFARRPLGVRTLASILDLPHSRRSRHEQIFVSGDGGEGFSLRDFGPEMRSLFQSTAYWNPAVPLGPDGRARLTIDLPDNVTTYRIMAVVAGKGGRAGSGEARVMVQKPLMVQPVLPRFLYPGDQLRVEALVFNGTDDGGNVRWSAELVGLGPAHAEARVTGEVQVDAARSGTIGFAARAKHATEARVRFVARLGTHTDAVEATIPILNPGVRRRVIVREPVSSQAELAVDLPAGRVPGSASLEVMVSSTRLGQLKESVDYLMGYPNGCIEQTTSRAYPLVVLQDLLPDMGVTVDAGQLKSYAEAGVKRLLSFQTSSGGLAYWPGSDEPHAFGTAFGLTALIEAKKRGYDVPDDALDRMASYLEQALGQGQITEEMPHGGMADADTRALFVMTLGRMGKPQPGHVSSLWRSRDKLTAFGLAFLAVAADELPTRDASMVQAMLAEVRARAKEEAQEAWYEGARDGGWSMGSPLRTHATALLAFAQSAPAHEVKQKLLTGLLNRQSNGLWGNTQENVFGIMAVAQAMRKTGDQGRGPEFELSINGKPAAGLEPAGASGSRVVVADAGLGKGPGPAHRQSILVKNRAATPAYVTVRAEYDVALDSRTMAAHSQGFEVARTYQRLDDRPINAQAIELGSIVRVHVRVTTWDKHNYVAIHDKLPAGLEPLNASLATTETVSQGKLTPDQARGLGVLSYSEIRDSRVAFYADDLPAGTYEFVYLARATTPGTFLRPAAEAEAMYQPDATGASAMDYVVIR